MQAYADARKPEPSSVGARERGGALPVAGAAPALTESTTAVEPAGEAERAAAAAKSEALAPWTQGVTRHEVETLREGKREADKPTPETLLHEGKRRGRREALLQSGRKLDGPSRVDRKEVAGRMYEALPRKGECEHAKALPPEAEHELDATPQLPREATQTRANVSPVGRGEGRRMKWSCPLGRDQAL